MAALSFEADFSCSLSCGVRTWSVDVRGRLLAYWSPWNCTQGFVEGIYSLHCGVSGCES